MRVTEQFDSDQWSRLQFAPFLILSGVSGRYRDFAPAEMAVFERWLDAAARPPGSLNPRSADLRDCRRRRNRGPVRGLRRNDVEWPQYRPRGSGWSANGFRHTLIHLLGAGIARARGTYGQEP